MSASSNPNHEPKLFNPKAVMSHRQILKAKQKASIVTLLFGFGSFASASLPNNVIVAITGDVGETVLTVPLTWMVGGLCGIVAAIGIYFNNRLDRMDALVAAHAVRLAHGDEKMDLLKEVRDKVSFIAEHGCSRQCPPLGSQPSQTKIYPTSQF